MTQNYRGTVIEGIGDDLIIGMLMACILFIPCVGYFVYWSQNRRSLTIHPNSATAVEDTRSRIQHAAQNSQSLDSHEGAENVPHRPVSRPRTDRTCPVCLAESTLAIETNCGHLFCGECMMTYWQHGNWLGAVRCPVCRQQVTLLMQSFTEEERRMSSEMKQTVIQQTNRYNRRFSGEPMPWMDYIRDLPTLLRHAIREVFTLSGLVWMFRMRIIICFIFAFFYFISPLDIIPEAAFGLLGLLDDFFVLLLLGIYVTIIYRRALAARAAMGSG